jgi:hypothetical protein
MACWRNARATVRKMLAASATVALAFDTACYAYVPMRTSAPAPAPGADVRVQLNREGTTELARYLGPRVFSADGKLSSVSSDGALVVDVSSVQIVDGPRQQWNGEGLVTFPQAYVTGVQVRTLDRRKSTIAGIVLAVSLAGIMELVIRGGGSSNAPAGGGPGGGIFILR